MPEPKSSASETFTGKSEMARLIRANNWDDHPLGAIEGWPESLKTSLRIILHSAYPMFIWWGPELYMFHNDAYIPVLGKKHPDALGESASEVWAEIWEDIGEMASGVLKGQVSYAEDLLLYLGRNGFLEETYWTFSYSPIYRSDGEVGGLFCACKEETSKILQQRRLKTLIDIAAVSTRDTSVKELFNHTLNLLEENPGDVPFAGIYLIDDDNNSASLYANSGLWNPYAVLDKEVTLNKTSPLGWDFSSIGNGHEMELRNGLLVDFQEEFEKNDIEVDQAVLLPITKAGEHRPAAILVCGISPYLQFDKDYSNFLKSVATAISRAKVDIRSYEMAHERARALSEIDEAKTAFFNNVSHEFRTPLTLMLGPLEELIQSNRGNGQAETLNNIYRNGQRLQKLVNTLLDFSRIESGKVQARFKRTDIATFTQNLASNFHSAIEKAGITFTLDLSEPEGAVYVDHEMWEKIVLNLISNALKFTFKGEIGVHLKDKGDRVQLEISDTGAGISNADQDRIFQRFYRIEGARARTHEGSGIGLALVQELVQAHGGEITVESELDKGSLFTVTLPIGKEHLPEDRVSENENEISTTGITSSFVDEALRWVDSEVIGDPNEAKPVSEATDREVENGSASVLVVEDDADMRKYLGELLSKKYTVRTVRNGRDALNLIEQDFRPDLILSDVMMPQLNGFQLLNVIKENPATATIPVILLSARAGEESMVAGMKKRADDYLVKPFSPRELTARVDARIEIAALTTTAEKNARESEDRLRSMIIQAPVAMSILQGEDLIIEIINKASATLVSKSVDELTGRPLLEVFPEFSGQTIEKILKNTFKTGETFKATEYPVIIERNGSRDKLYFTIVLEPIRDLSGKVNRIMTVAIDESAQVAARQLAEKREQYFKNMANDVPVMVWMTDIRGNCTYLNKQWLDYTGQTHEEGLGNGWLNPIHPDDRAEAERIYRESTGQGGYFEMIYRLKKSTGEYLWHMDAGMPRTNSSGELEGYTGAVINIHERKMVEDALKQSENELRSAVSAANLGTWTHHLKSGKLTFSNRSKELFGLSEDAKVDYSTFGKGLHPDDKEPTEKALMETIESKSDQPCILEYRTIGIEDGKLRWLRASGQPFFDKNGDIEVFIGTLLDITEHKALIKQKDDFLAIASHELKTPVTSIKGYVQMIAEDFAEREEEDASGQLQIVDRQVDKLILLINELLDASKIEAGELQLNKELFDFDELVNEVLESMQLINPEHKLIKKGHTGCLVFGDRNRIEQVLVNLISNAIKFSPGESEVHISSFLKNGNVCLKVKDFGVGIQPQNLKKIFNRFYRDEQTSQWSTGLGLGLFISTDIIKRHKGTIKVESELKKGTVFHITLPYQNYEKE